MKNWKYVWMILLACCLAGCYEVKEEIVINPDGSGSYTSNMNMSKLLEMLQNFGGEEALSKDGLDRPVDTTVLMKDVVDKIRDSTISKELWRNGKMDIKLNTAQKIFNTTTLVPFRNADDLRQLMARSGIVPGMKEIFKDIFGKKDTAGTQQSDDAQQPDLGQISNIFDITTSNGLISKKINTGKYKALMQRADVQQARQMSRQGMEIVYTTVIRLPRAAKKITNPLLRLSDDKKTVTAIFNVLDIFNSPDKFSYTIEY